MTKRTQDSGCRHDASSSFQFNSVSFDLSPHLPILKILIPARVVESHIQKRPWMELG